MSTPNNRKRPAPDTIAALQQQIQQQQAAAITQPPIIPQGPNFAAIGDQVIRWNGDTSLMMDPNGNSLYSGLVPNTQGQFVTPTVATAANSTALTRRAPGGRALMPTTRPGFDGTQASQWSAMLPANGNNALATIAPAAPSTEMIEQTHLQKLEAIAQEAKKDAMAHKKQIPPFVQKLSSFLDDKSGKYHDLIRWSEKGDSFFVMNEDEFAKKLIPDLFKHNNYASFVRQLNMYGFHKRVGLSDNSMRASERKNKSPSEYYNDFFRRGHPDLLWLITKPKNNKNKNRHQAKTESDGESGDEVLHDDASAKSNILGQTPKVLPPNEYGISRKELAQLKEELRKCRENQAVINQNLQQSQEEHRELFRIHKRHEQHIRAILGFLAIHFRKSLEDPNSSGNFGEMLANFIPPNQMNHQSTVFDVGEYVASNQPAQSPMGTAKRARHLLEAPPSQHAPNGIINGGPLAASQTFHPEMGSVTEILEHTPAESMRGSTAAPTPSDLHNLMSDQANNGVFNGLVGANGVSSASIPRTTTTTTTTTTTCTASPHRSTVESVRTSPVIPRATPVTMPSIINPPLAMTPTGIPGTSSTVPVSVAAPITTPPMQTIPMSTAGINPLANVPSTLGASPVTSALSPILRSIQAPTGLQEPSHDDFLRVQRMVQEQDNTIQEITNRIGPLSPSGRLPFDLTDSSGLNYFNNDPGAFDINEFLDSSAYNADDSDFPNFDPLASPVGTTSDIHGLSTTTTPTTTIGTPVTTTMAPVSTLAGLGNILPAQLSALGIPPGADLSDLSMNSPVLESSMPAAGRLLDEDLLSGQLPQPDLKRRRVN